MKIEFQQEIVMYACSVCGSLLLWAKSTIQKKKVFGFGDIAERLLPDKPRAQYILQFLIFVLLGGMIGLIFTGPDTPRQAITAGMAWSRITTKD